METPMSNPHEGGPERAGEDRQFTIVVNAQETVVQGKELTFDQIVALAFPGGHQGGNWVHTITYRRGMGNKPEGSLVSGETVRIKERMIFNVTATYKS
jgi:hypothetical protein